jgi:hypothetical protein
MASSAAAGEPADENCAGARPSEASTSASDDTSYVLDEDEFGKKKRKLSFDQEITKQKKSCLDLENENDSERQAISSVWDLELPSNVPDNPLHDRLDTDGYETSMSEISHHSVVPNRGSADDSDGNLSQNDWCVIPKKKKNAALTSRGNVTQESDSKQNIPCSALKGHTSSLIQPDPNKSEVIRKNTSSQDHRPKPKSNNRHSPNYAQSVPPTFCEFPVIVQDLKTSPATLKALVWKLSDILSKSIGPGVRQIKPLGNNKFLIGCDSFRQQSRLVALTVLGGIDVKCSVPVPSVQGVIH